MPEQKRSRIVIDTNLLISFLIGKELHALKDLIVHERVIVIISEQLVEELTLVTSRETFRKYFDPDKVRKLITLLEIIGERVHIKKVISICRDPKDDFFVSTVQGR